MASPLTPHALFSLAGRTALVTGGSLGIGAMVAEGFVAAGASVVLAARGADELTATATRLRDLDGGAEVTTIVADLGTTEGCAALVDAVGQHTDHLDVVVHSAGATALTPVDSASEADWDRILDLNLRAVHRLTAGLLPLLVARASAEEPSRSIVIGSSSGLVTSGMPDLAYGASKAAVHHLVRYQARELAPRHVLVNAIAPGLFPTRMSAFLDHDAIRGPVLSTIPLGRPGRAEEIAGAALFLATRAGGYVTGEVLVVDGGRSGAGRADPVAGL